MLFYHLRGEQLSQWMSDVNNRKDQKSKLFDIISDFLKSTGQNQLINQVNMRVAKQRIEWCGLTEFHRVVVPSN